MSDNPDNSENFDEIIQEYRKAMRVLQKQMQPAINYKIKISEDMKRITNHWRSTPKINIDWGEVAEDLKKFDELLSLLAKKGWVIPTYFLEEYNFRDIPMFNKHNVDNINKLMVSFYVRSDYKYLFKELDNLENEVMKGFSSQVHKVKTILKTDMRNYTLCMPVLFSILDGMFIEFIRVDLSEYEEEPNNISLNNHSLNIVKKHHLKEDEMISVTNSLLESMFKAIPSKFKSTNFREVNQHYSRHSVLHGAMAPDEYPFIEFIKLVNLCSVFAMFI